MAETEDFHQGIGKKTAREQYSGSVEASNTSQAPRRRATVDAVKKRMAQAPREPMQDLALGGELEPALGVGEAQPGSPTNFYLDRELDPSETVHTKEVAANTVLAGTLEESLPPGSFADILADQVRQFGSDALVAAIESLQAHGMMPADGPTDAAVPMLDENVRRLLSEVVDRLVIKPDPIAQE